MPPAVEVTRLTFAYRTAPVVRDVSFAVAPGAVTIIIGPNGSGKTTLLKLLAGIEPAPRDTVTLLGRPAAAYTRRDLAKTLTLVPQLTAEAFPFTVAEVVLMGRAPHTGMLGIEGAADHAAAEAAMAVTGVSRLARRRIGELSGGERQWVFIARALCQEPKILLLDEPTAALDLAHQVRIMDIMAELSATRGLTVAMVSHDINLAAMYADTMLLIDGGKVLAEGAPEEVLRRELLETVYRCPIHVDRHPLTDTPSVLPIPGNINES